MCGIFGLLGPNSSQLEEEKDRIHQVMNHRGPDDRGFVRFDHVALGFNRLSILDVSNAGHQPMLDISERYTLVFNGEIFNYVELKNRFLEDVEFRSSGDTEVLLQLLIRFGQKAITMLNGMFAFCFIDHVERRFLLARDRFGIKPLYFSVKHRHLSFSSELKGLPNFSDMKYTLNHQAILDFLGSGYIGGEHSVFNEVNRLKPGHYMKGSLERIEESSLVIRPYWKLSVAPNQYQNEEDPKQILTYLESLKELTPEFLKATVQYRLSDNFIRMVLLPEK